MTIQFACDCGQQLAAREEHAGKRVRCTACGEVRIVPARGPAQPPPRVAAVPELIRFHCSCGQICQAKPEHAGRSTRCPRCSTVLTIPAGAVAREAPAPRRPAAIQADEPVHRPVSRRAVEGDEDFEDERPQRRRRAKKSKAWIWISAAAVLLLVGGGLALWLLLRGGIDSDFDLVPRDAQGFATVRVADLVDSPLGKKVVDKFEPQMKQLEEMEKQFGLTRKDIERVTWVAVDFEKEIAWAIIQTRKDYDKDKVLSTTKEKAGNLEEKSSDGKKYYLGERGSLALCFHSDRIIVMAPSAKAMERCLALPKKPKSGPLDEALELASKRKTQLAAGINLPSTLMEQGRQQMKQEAGGVFAAFTTLLEFNTAYVTVAVKEDIDWEIGLIFPDSQKAKTAKETISGLVSAMKVFLPAIEQAVKQQGLGKGRDIGAEARKALDQLDPKQSGKTVTISGRADGKELMNALEESLKMWMGGADRQPDVRKKPEQKVRPKRQGFRQP